MLLQVFICNTKFLKDATCALVCSTTNVVVTVLCIYQCSPAPEHAVTKRQHNDDLLKELFPDSSDEENEVPSTSTSSVNNNDCNSSLIASLVCCVCV